MSKSKQKHELVLMARFREIKKLACGDVPMEQAQRANQVMKQLLKGKQQ